MSSSTIQKNISGLSCNTEYEWKIRSKCGEEFSAFSEIQTFSTASCRIVNDKDELTHVLIFPNPSTDIISIDVNKFNSDEIGVEIYNLMGEKVFTENFIGDKVIEIDIVNFAKGNYVIKINSEEAMAVEGIIIQ